MAQTTKRTLILGLGNLLLGDEGIGVHVVHALQQHPLGDDVEAVDGGTGGLALLLLCRERQRVIIVDAVDVPAAPGSVFRFTPQQAELMSPPPRSAHDGGCMEFLQHLKHLEDQPDVVIIGVVPADISSLSLVLSPTLQRQLPTIIATVLREASVNSVGTISA